MMCEHPIEALVGMADGVHCTKCGAVFKAVPVKIVATIEEQPEAAIEEKPEAAAEEKPKKKGGKKGCR